MSRNTPSYIFGEKSCDEDPSLDYCLWQYEPRRGLRTGDIRKSTLLGASIANLQMSTKMKFLIDAIQLCFGVWRTVFGIKWDGGRLSWELYFYDYERWARHRGMRDFVEATADILNVTAPTSDSLPYFMFSVEFDERHVINKRPINQFDIYMGLPDGGVSAGACYGLTQAGFELRNVYHFYDAQNQTQDARERACATVRFDARVLDLSQLFWPELSCAQVIVVANKRYSDALYFSRIEICALEYFLGRLQFPEHICRFVAQNREKLSHHLFDVGFDYVVEGGTVRCTKGSFYGVF